jgi:hypothetical protein
MLQFREHEPGHNERPIEEARLSNICDSTINDGAGID